jgi:hypothetical protein
MHSLGLGIAGPARAELGRATQTIGYLRMFRAKSFLQDRQGLTVERLGLGVTTLNCMDVGEVVQTVGYF